MSGTADESAETNYLRFAAARRSFLVSLRLWAMLFLLLHEHEPRPMYVRLSGEYNRKWLAGEICNNTNQRKRKDLEDILYKSPARVQPAVTKLIRRNPKFS